ncbi:MAG TPA: hypothetical protein VEC16_07205 [Alphaproteobacteria bacterium]|nr:hypothetical protein [Alphaproteobacteria bacterium]
METLENKIDAVEINKFIRKSFGRRVKGNYSVTPTQIDDIVIEKSYLRNILKKKWFGTEYLLIGKFTEEDGSELSVFPKYKKEAEKYSRLFQEKTGKKAIVNIEENLQAIYYSKGTEEDIPSNYMEGFPSG